MEVMVLDSMTELKAFQSGIKSPFLFIQEAVKQRLGYQ